jgi:hypothetical protein
MPVSPEDRRKVIDLFDQIDAAEVKRAVVSVDAFETWLRHRLPDIYHRIKERVVRFWDWISSAFKPKEK